MLVDVLVIACIGLLLSLYGLFIERRLKVNQSYKPVCDISDKVSCTKTFLSPWGKITGVSNVYVGAIVYAIMIIVAVMGNAQLAFVGACILVVGSLFLAYILLTKIRTFCLLCTAIYIVNVALFLAAARHLYM